MSDSKPAGRWEVHKDWLTRSELLRGEPLRFYCRREGSSQLCGVMHASNSEARRHAGELNAGEAK